jgi:hypothetical protein
MYYLENLPFLRHTSTVVVWSSCNSANQQGSIWPIRRGYRKRRAAMRFVSKTRLTQRDGAAYIRPLLFCNLSRNFGIKNPCLFRASIMASATW